MSRGKGQPRAFATGEIFKEKAMEYIEKCELNEKLANIAGFCVFCDITRETFYKQKEYYSDIYKKVNDMLEDAAINTHKTTMGIFYLKNKFGYKDKLETENTNKTTADISLNMSTLTDEQLDKILKSE